MSKAEARLTLEKGTSLWKDAWLRLGKNKLAMAGLSIVLLICFSCFVLRWFMPHNPNDVALQNKFAAPGALSIAEEGETAHIHLLGTDQLGRDLFTRILDGGQISLFIAIAATLLTATIGIIYGAVSGYAGGRIDNGMMRIVDGLLAMPFLIVVILFRELISVPIDEAGRFLIGQWNWDRDLVIRFQNLIPLLLAIAAFGWLTMARIVRTQTAALRSSEFVEAARSLGLSHTRIIFRHILPNMLGPVIIYATLTIPSFILYEATLSFIGLGLEPPNSSWGILIKEGANYLETRSSMLIFPAIIFSATLFSFNFLGDGLRDALDPKAAKD